MCDIKWYPAALCRMDGRKEGLLAVFSWWPQASLFFSVGLFLHLQNEEVGPYHVIESGHHRPPPPRIPQAVQLTAALVPWTVFETCVCSRRKKMDFG